MEKWWEDLTVGEARALNEGMRRAESGNNEE